MANHFNNILSTSEGLREPQAYDRELQYRKEIVLDAMQEEEMISKEAMYREK